MEPTASNCTLPGSIGVTRHPAVPVAMGLTAGIVLDRWLTWPWHVWALFCLAFLLASGVLLFKHRLWTSAIILFCACVCVGAARHHMAWSTRSPADIARYATMQPRPVRVRAVVVSQPQIIPATRRSAEADWSRKDRTLCTMRALELYSGRERKRIGGLVRVDVVGRLDRVDIGDIVWVFGNLSRPRPARNPGEFDFREYLRRRCIGCLIRSNGPECVVAIGRDPWFLLARIRSRFRQRCDALFQHQLPPSVASVTRALLLGSRSDMNDDVRQDFAESGTIHLLAISGLHVGILASFLLIACRMLHLSTKQTTLVLLIGIGWYAFVTDARPPVLRASTLVLIAAAGMPWYRQATASNTLAIAALVVLLWNPTDLFDAGAQLSFLAVIAILWSARWNHAWLQPKQRRPITDPRRVLIARSRFYQFSRFVGSATLKGYLMTASIWLFTAPLVASRFHLVSPVGLLLNVLLIPLIVIALWMGYALMAVGLLIPFLAYPFALAVGAVLRFLLAIVNASAEMSIGHFYVPGPPTWWLIGFYAVLAIIVSIPKRRAVVACLWRLIGVWCIVGLSVGLSRASEKNFRCTVLAVGHGCGVLVELPTGKTLLYDAGAISNGARAREIILGALWQRGRSRIDALVISHADLDHYSAVPDLLRMIPVGTLLVARPFLDFSQAGVGEICELASVRNVPIRLIWAGDRIVLDPSTRIDVLHPSLAFHGNEDNENSVVLRIAYAGHRILLTGDLSGAGLFSLMRQPGRPTDLMLSPHHGSPSANPPELANWARPRFVICSESRTSNLDAIRENYFADTTLLSTATSGAITAQITSSGKMTVHGFRSRVTEWKSPP